MPENYSNLQNRTFLDFTADQGIISLIIGNNDKDFFQENVSVSGRFVTFLELAELINGKQLEQEVVKQFPNMFDE